MPLAPHSAGADIDKNEIHSGFTKASADIYISSGEDVTAYPTMVSSDGTKATVSDVAVSFRKDSSDVLIDKSGVPTLTNAMLKDPTIRSEIMNSVGDQIITAKHAAISISGTKIPPGGSTVTVARTPVQIPSSGIVMVGNSTIAVGSGNPSGQAFATSFTGTAVRRSSDTHVVFLAVPLVVVLYSNIV